MSEDINKDEAEVQSENTEIQSKDGEALKAETGDAAADDIVKDIPAKVEKREPETSSRETGGDARRSRPRSDRGGFKDSPKNAKFKRKVCRFCQNKNLKIDYKDSAVLGNFITDRGKILPRRITGACAKHQRDVSTAIKRARILSVLPFVVK